MAQDIFDLFGQIYPTLADLERHRLVTRRGSSRPGSSTFVITAAGRARLTELLGQPIQPVPARNGLMLWLFFGRHLGPETCHSLISEARANTQRRLAQYQEIRDQIEADHSHQQDYSYWLLKTDGTCWPIWVRALVQSTGGVTKWRVASITT
jgi:DNA-binding PadR family transcriptional regulator